MDLFILFPTVLAGSSHPIHVNECEFPPFEGLFIQEDDV